MDAVELMATIIALALLALAVTLAVIWAGVVWWHALLFLCAYNFCTSMVRGLKNMA